MNNTKTSTPRTGTVRADEVRPGELLTTIHGVLFPTLVLEATPVIDLSMRRAVEFRLDGVRDTVLIRASQTVFVEPNTAH